MDKLRRQLATKLLDPVEALLRQHRAYEELKPTGSVSFEDAVKVASHRMKEAIRPAPTGAGADLLAGLVLYYDYVPASRDLTNIDFQRLVEQAKADFNAYLVLKLVDQIVVNQGNFPALTDARRELYLGTFPVPRRPPGRPPYANLSRDTLIIGEIEKLVTLGFAPNRNGGTASHDSACDVIVAALAANGYHMLTYKAVETIWTGRSRLKHPKVALQAILLVFGLEPG